MEEVLINIFGTMFFFLPGFLFTYVIFKRFSLSEMISYTALFSVFASTVISFLLLKFDILSINNFIICLLILSLLFIITILFKKIKIKIFYDKSRFLFLFIFSIFGTMWRWFFRLKTFSWGDGITSHINSVIIEKLFNNGYTSFSIPNVGFYTGMLVDHSKIVAGNLTQNFYSLIGITGFFETFISIFILAFFVYKVIYAYRKNTKLALLGSFIVASLGPVEIWHNTFLFIGGNLAYVGFISLFIMYMDNSKEFFYLTLSLLITLALTYYTAILVLIIGILGFIFAIGLKYILGNKGRGHKIIINEIIKNRIFLKYCILLIFLCSLFFLFSGDSLIKHAENTVSSVIQNAHDSYGSSLSLFNKLEILDKKNISVVSTVTPRPIRPYQNVYKFLRISPLNWQNLFILLIGFTFIISIYKKKSFRRRSKYFGRDGPCIYCCISFCIS
jgi:hypothetical protein